MKNRVLWAWTLLAFLLPLGLIADMADPPPVGKFRNTFYYLVYETDFAGLPLDAAMLDPEDRLIARVSHAYKRAVDMEGSGRLLDGRVINFAGRKPDGIRYAVTVHPFGRGVGNCPLIPFRTLAVDPKRIPLGSVVRIDESVGMRLPDGSIHDGLWRAEDVGGAIREDRVDLFVGDENQGALLNRSGIKHLMPLTIRIVAPPAKVSCVDDPPLA